MLAKALVLSAGCASHPTPDFDHFSWRLDLPVDTTAAIVAGAVQRATGCDQPLGPGGAIAEPLAGGGFRITYHRDGVDWQPCGSVRLCAQGSEPRILVAPRGPLGGDARVSDALLDLRVRQDGDATLVTGRLPTSLRRSVNDALQLAIEPDAALPGLDEPNLARHVAAALRRRAEQAQAAGDDEAAAQLRRRAVALGGAGPSLLLQVGDHAASSGDDARARASYWQALARCQDPAARAAIGTRLAALDAQGDAEASRRAALARLAAGDPARAAGLLHRAQRGARDPSRDYSLLGALHRQGRQLASALASELLAREHQSAKTLPQPSLTPNQGWQVEATAPAFASPIR